MDKPCLTGYKATKWLEVTKFGEGSMIEPSDEACHFVSGTHVFHLSSEANFYARHFGYEYEVLGLKMNLYVQSSTN